MKVLTAAQMREVDRLSTERFGIPGLQLMENAGNRVVEFLEQNFREPRRSCVFVVSGKGNNGGDGLVVARLLQERGVRPVAVLCGDPNEVRGDASANLDRYRRSGGELILATNASEWAPMKTRLAQADIIVDALLGTGLRGPVEGWLADVVADLNAVGKKSRIIAVDIPSGLSADSGEVAGPAVDAEATVTFTAPKIGELLYPASSRVGHLEVVSIGSPRALIDECSDSNLRWLEPAEFLGLRFRRKADANKGNFGHALVTAGSVGKSGAAVMAGWAALRAGAGLVTVAAPDDCVPVIGAHTPEMMTEPLASTEAGTLGLRSLEYNVFTNILRGKSILAMGPGLTTYAETQQFVRNVVRDSGIPLVLDADGLNAFAGRSAELAGHSAPEMVITPHPGEMARLLGTSISQVQANRLEVARKGAVDWKTAVVLKGHQTVIASPDGRAWINSTGNPGMAKAGSGDVLTGMLAGILAQHGSSNWYDGICLAVYLHGLAGDIAAREIGEISMMATDLISAIPRAYAHLLAELDHVER